MLATNLSDEAEASGNADRQVAIAGLAGSDSACAMPLPWSRLDAARQACRNIGHDAGDAMGDLLATQQNNTRA